MSGPKLHPSYVRFERLDSSDAPELAVEAATAPRDSLTVFVRGDQVSFSELEARWIARALAKGLAAIDAAAGRSPKGGSP